MSSLQQRWISAILAIPLFLGLVFWGPVPFALAVFFLAVLALGELVRSYRAAGIAVNLPAATLGVALPAWVWTIAWRSRGLSETDLLGALTIPAVGALLWLLAAMLWEVAAAARAEDIHAGRNFAIGLLCGVYVSLFAGMAWLRAIHVPANVSDAAPLLLTVFCVWATDSFALFTGKAFGKHKLVPRLSPGKTVEGAVGGLAASLLFGALFGWIFFRNAGLGLAVGAVAGVFGQAGDLFKSALKRELGIKDFGAVLPGHGGVLDRFDSLLFVAPLAAVLFSVWR